MMFQNEKRQHSELESWNLGGHFPRYTSRVRAGGTLMGETGLKVPLVPYTNIR